MNKAIRFSAMRLAYLAAIVLATVVVTVAVMPTTGRAYNNVGAPLCKFPYNGGSTDLVLPWVNGTLSPPTGAYSTAYSLARGNWNSTASPVFFTLGSASTPHTLSAGFYGMGVEPGRTTWTCSGGGNVGIRFSTVVILNRSWLDTESATFKRSVASHELGHFISLSHSTVSSAVMRITRDPEIIYTAQADDVCGVNHMYISTSWPPACGY